MTDSLLGTYRRAPMELVRAEGVRLYDADGKAYLDFASGIAVNALGYNDAGVNAAIAEAAATGLIHTSNLFRTAPGEQLADKLVAASFADKVFFCNSGAEANEGAFKFARRWARNVGGPAKHEIISLRGAFHGRLFGTVAATDRPQYRNHFRPLAGGIHIHERSIDELSRVISDEQTAAVIAEPIQGEGGVRVLDAGFVRELRALTAERNVLLILDEIQCGYGRTGSFFAYEQYGITPDLLTMAKPMAGGLPMGAVLLTQRVAEAVQPGDHGTTFGGGPLVAHVANHVFDRLRDPALLAHVRREGEWLGDQLLALSARSAKVRAIRGRGFMWGVDVTDPAKDVVARALSQGLILVGAGDHTLRLLPPLVMERRDLAQGLNALEAAIG
ncbi:acetylornithine transaminase [Pseudogemmatithrix spongiicola]|uniref:Acetylornithine transaminase n=1 Tax=Pseudogemmatithrix spongiicola TaxID=3062599 RepID=A0AA49Q6J4_9BACT|nr:acetylornithine transaminase [Gemmatimonadaceae bacterium 'strain 138']WKW13739.1 acetylornithine transaminase [Gemmatimonadaceae bacterium 'strain 318']